MKRFLKWLLIGVAVLFVLVVLGLAVLFYSREKILRHLVEQSILDQTGMVAEIGGCHVGLR